MIKRLLKAVPISLVALFTLTSCAFIENILGTILVNAAMAMPILVNGIDLMPEGTAVDPVKMDWAGKLPTDKDDPEELNYFKNILIVPKTLGANVFGLNLRVNFNVTITNNDNEDVSDLFKAVTLTSSQLPEGFSFDLSSLPFPVDFSLTVYIPVGESEILEDANDFESLQTTLTNTSPNTLLKETDQATESIKLHIDAQGGNTKKNKSFFFRLTKPEFGAVILDTLYDLEYFVSIFDYDYKAPAGEEKKFDLRGIQPADRPTDPENPMEITYFKETIVVAKEIQLAAFNDPVTVDVVLTENKAPGVENLIYQSTTSEPAVNIIGEPNEGEEAMVTGNIYVHTFTPVGSFYDDMPEVEDIREIGDSFSPDGKFKELYNATQDEGSFSLEVTVNPPDGSEPRSETYYFKLVAPPLDDEIIDYAMDTEYIVNVIRYDKVENLKEDDIRKLGKQATSAVAPIEVEYLTETIAVPSKIVLLDYGLKTINFTAEVVELDQGEPAISLYRGSKELVREENGEDINLIEGVDATVQTFTMTGGFNPGVPDNQLEKFAEEVQDLAQANAAQLYTHVSSEPRNFKLVVTGTIEDENAEFPATATKEYYFRAIPANINQEISDFLIDDDSLVNIVNYENATQETPAPDDFAKIANHPDVLNPNERYKVEHLADTIVIPSEINLTKYGGKQLHINYDIIDRSEPLEDPIDFYEAQLNNIEIDGNTLVADTITSPGTYKWQDKGVPENKLDAFAEAITELDQRDLYNATQAGSYKFDIEVSVTIFEPVDPSDLSQGYRDSGVAPQRKTFYFETENYKVSNKRIAEAVANEYDGLVNILKVKDFIDNPGAMNNVTHNPTNVKNPLPVKLFTDTVILPTSFEYEDFGGINLDFKVTPNHTLDDEYFFESSRDHVFEEKEVSGIAYTAISTLNTKGATSYEEFAALFSGADTLVDVHTSNEAYKTYIETNSPLTFSISVDIVVNNDPASKTTVQYFFVIIPSEISDVPGLQAFIDSNPWLFP